LHFLHRTKQATTKRPDRRDPAFFGFGMTMQVEISKDHPSGGVFFGVPIGNLGG
jgi:hypothetical protein